VREFLSSLAPQDLLLCAISGGGSALVVDPLPPVTLAELQDLNSVLLSCGATVEELNTLRRHLDRLKGGNLVHLANQATILSLILSDVPGDALEAIASGLTAPDPTTRGEALAVLERHRLGDRIPDAIRRVLEAGPETPKPGDLLFQRVRNVIIGNNLLAAQAALRQAEGEGFHPYLLRCDLRGEASQVGVELSTLLRQAGRTRDPVSSPACLIAGGETTVTVRGPGRGGRNTELALAAVSELAGFPDVLLVTLASDGEDGRTDAAGAMVSGETYARARRLGLNPANFLQQNDSYTFFAALNDLLKPGPTGTNVSDLVFLFLLGAPSHRG
jgi:hydroxypyruvate reductase